MTLKKYKKKRNFKHTPEPSGAQKIEKSRKSLCFVMQKHAAKNLHYDFRLEGDGVLVSWAIPKGPSLNPSDKRLAIRTEDHPLAYRDFEGIIPEGNYGAGAVIIWDRGDYFIDEKLSRSKNIKLFQKKLENGKISFYLNGDKLSGWFTLIRLKNKKNQWLLIKNKDDYANNEKNIIKADKSVVSGLTIREIEQGLTAKTQSLKNNITGYLEKLKLNKSKMSSNVKPMLASLIDSPFNDDQWIFEIKWDGFRAIFQRRNEESLFYSRNIKDFSKKFPYIFSELKKIPYNLILDGEIVGLKRNGVPDFKIIKNYKKNQNSIYYYVFDLLYFEGYKLVSIPLSERKKILKRIIPNSKGRIRYCDHVEGSGMDFFSEVKKIHIEGIIAKKKDSIYQPNKRSNYWLKIKSVKQQEFIIAGYTAPKGSRRYLGSLLLGIYQNNKLISVGHVGTGLDREERKNLKSKMDKLIISTCPFASEPTTNEKPTWIKPKLVVEVEFQDWTESNQLRQPVYIGLRYDKSPQQVKKEISKKLSKIKSKKGSSRKKFSKEPPESNNQKKIKAGRRNIYISHPNKHFFQQYTKLDIVNYYLTISKSILPYLKNRPLVLRRFPDGIQAEGFYQKHYDADTPEWVETIEVFSKSKNKNIRYIICQNAATLAWLVNQGCIDMHPWNAQKKNLDHPDYAVMDLDPENINFSHVVETALMVKAVIEELGIKGYCKTSGKSGLHVFVPLKAVYSHNVSRYLMQMVAQIVHKRLPKITSLERSPSKRQKKVYLDYLQNRSGQTMVSPYSIRPTAAALISTPLLWEEVNDKLDPHSFTIETVIKRLKKQGDLWRPVLGKGVNLKRIISNLIK